MKIPADFKVNWAAGRSCENGGVIHTECAQYGTHGEVISWVCTHCGHSRKVKVRRLKKTITL